MFALPISKPRFKSSIFFIKIALKLSYFCKKMQKFRELGVPPPNPRAFGDWGLCPQTPSLRRGRGLRTCVYHKSIIMLTNAKYVIVMVFV